MTLSIKEQPVSVHKYLHQECAPLVGARPNPSMRWHLQVDQEVCPSVARNKRLHNIFRLVTNGLSSVAMPPLHDLCYTT